MARIEVPRTQPELQRVVPAPVQSRQVGFEVHVPMGVGADGFGYTPVVGQRVWLLGIDFWAFGVDPGVRIGGFISIATGPAEPKSGGEIAAEWEHCMQYSGIKPMMYWWLSLPTHFHWNMKRLYTGEPRRFACGIQNFSATDDWWAWVFFEIAEG